MLAGMRGARDERHGALGGVAGAAGEKRERRERQGASPERRHALAMLTGRSGLDKPSATAGAVVLDWLPVQRPVKSVFSSTKQSGFPNGSCM